MAEKEPYLVLGLDPGIASCGFCLLDTNNKQILEMGSHLFKAPREDKTQVSLAVSRRKARGSRRNNLRTKHRLEHCVKLLQEAGVVPQNITGKKWFQSRKGDKPLLQLRKEALERKLSNREFAQILYVLCNRRGYISHGLGKSGEGTDDEGKKVLSAIKANTEEMAKGGYRTVGEMLYAKNKSRNKSGNYDLCVYNTQIQDEVKTIFEAQRTFGSPFATPELEQVYLDCLIWEKKSIEHDERVYNLVGKCIYFPEEYPRIRRAAHADISSELCIAYERFGHLAIVRDDGSEIRLTPARINGYIEKLFSSEYRKPGSSTKEVTYATIRKDLDLNKTDYFKGVDRDKENKEEVFVPKAWRTLRDYLPKEFLQKMLDNREFGDEICEALAYASTEDSLKTRLENLELTDEELDELINVPFAGKVFKGYGNRSLKALNLLIDSFEDDEILTLADAEAASGLDKKRNSDKNERGLLLPAYSIYDKNCTNPVVLRAMGRMRRIINAIIKIYGPLNEIHIELGNELKQSKREKEAIWSAQKKNKAAKDKWRKDAAERLGLPEDEIPNELIRKLILREEQNCIDLYTGESISLDSLLRDEKYCEIDHALPYSRTSDNHPANRVLTLWKNNQNKKERTPYEWMTSGEVTAPSWEEYVARVNQFVHSAKRKRYLLNTNLDEEAEAKFINRNLNDTRYMARAVKSYLEDNLIFGECNTNEGNVRAVAGGATGNLRWVWGLNFGENNTKDRSDDRHHAVDAAIIAACNTRTIQKVANTRKLGYETFKRMRESRLADTQPWPTFAVEVAARREFVIPTRMVDHGVTGQAFKETLYHYEGRNEKNYPLLKAKTPSSEIQVTNPEGNIRTNADGSAQIFSGMAFLRLWLDPNFEGRGGKKGKWYAEPVYYADMSAIKNKAYKPKACLIRTARVNWPDVPEAAMVIEPLILFSGDVLCINGHYGRYNRFHVGNCALDGVLNLKTGEPIKAGFPSGVNSWDAQTDIKIIQEDCLGHCYKNLILEA